MKNWLMKLTYRIYSDSRQLKPVARQHLLRLHSCLKQMEENPVHWFGLLREKRVLK
jgi:hypothetical protein